MKNPYVLDRNPCGSSSGTGAAIAANLAAIGVGTETDGSIVCPSGATGLVGIKPTIGLVSRAGIIPIAHSQDTAGPMARTVADAAVLLSALAGIDPRDGTTRTAGARAARDYTRNLDAGALKGARIGVARKRYFGYSAAADRLVEQAIADMKARGAVIVDPADIPTAAKMDDCETRGAALRVQGRSEHLPAARGPSSSVRSLADLIAFNEREKAREMPFFGQELFISAEKKGPLTVAGLPDRAQRLPRAGARAGHRPGDAPASPRRDRRAHRQAGVDDRPGQRRSLCRCQLDAGSRCRLSQHHRTGRPGVRAAGRDSRSSGGAGRSRG